MIICIVGPTAVGKTKLSIELAKKYNAIVVNCDSTQVYKGMNIGTAKVTEEEKEGVPHYLFDIVDPDYNYTVYDYQKDARKIIEENKGRNIILVGGTGLYLKAALYNYEFSEETNENQEYNELSNEELYALALKKDSNMNIHQNNRKRLIRFLNKENIKQAERYPIYDAIYIGLTTDRKTLYDRINERADIMFKSGLLEEVKEFYDKKEDSKAINTAIGYKELYKYFSHEISLEEAIDLIKKNSRHYAKRQYTWFKNQMDIDWLEVDFNNFDNTINKAIELIEQKNNDNK